MDLHFLTFEGANAFPQHISLWNTLLADAHSNFEAPGFFLSENWLGPWLEHCGPQEKFFWAVLEDRDSKRWLAALPMAVVCGSLFGARLRHLVVAGYPDSDCLFIPAESNEARGIFVEKLLDYWETALDGVVACDLREMPEGGPTELALADWAQKNHRSIIFQTVARSPCYSIEQAAENGGGTKGRLGRNLRRHQRILDEAGQARYEFGRVPADAADEKLRICSTIEEQSWKGEKKVGVLSEANMPFIAAVWRNLIRDDQLVLGTLTLDGKPIAYHWGMVFDGVFLSYNMAQVSSADVLSPGTLLLDHMIHHAHPFGIREFDASRGGLSHNHSLAHYKGPVRFHRRMFMCRRSVLGRLMAWRVRRYITEQKTTCTD